MSFKIGLGAPRLWLSVAPGSGTVAAGGSQALTLGIDATGYPIGTYTGEVVVETNDPQRPSVTVAVEMSVAAALTLTGGEGWADARRARLDGGRPVGRDLDPGLPRLRRADRPPDGPVLRRDEPRRHRRRLPAAGGRQRGAPGRPRRVRLRLRRRRRARAGRPGRVPQDAGPEPGDVRAFGRRVPLVHRQRRELRPRRDADGDRHRRPGGRRLEPARQPVRRRARLGRRDGDRDRRDGPTSTTRRCPVTASGPAAWAT